jgi:hypothetical protein
MVTFVSAKLIPSLSTLTAEAPNFGIGVGPNLAAPQSFGICRIELMSSNAARIMNSRIRLIGKLIPKNANKRSLFYSLYLNSIDCDIPSQFALNALELQILESI